jgi:PilZ domain-containing protein
MPTQHRSEPRFLCADLVKLRWSAEAKRDQEQTVVLENISASGACVQSEIAIGENVRVTLDCGKCEFRGRVRSCYSRDDAYFVGIEFDADSKWSKAKYMPEHLLDPRQVKPRRSGSKPLVMCAGTYA